MMCIYQIDHIFITMKVSDGYKASPNRQTKHIQLSNTSDQQKNNQRTKQLLVLPRFVEEELDLNVQKYSQQIKEQIRYILVDLLRYPLTTDAQRHRTANRLGYFDLKHVKNKKVSQNLTTATHNNLQVCEDCGLLIQEKQIPICASVWQFPGAGLATYFFFEKAKIIMGLLFTLGCIFSIITLIANLQDPTVPLDATTYPFKVSSGSAMLLYSMNSAFQFLLNLQGWLLVGSVVIWWVLAFIVKCFSTKYERIVDVSCFEESEFTLMLTDVPLNFTQQILQNQFNRYYESFITKKNINFFCGGELKPFKIQKITKVIPFPLLQDDVLDKQLDGLDEDILQKKKLFSQWIYEMRVNAKFTYSKKHRLKEEIEFENMLERRRKKVIQMQERVTEQYKKVQKSRSFGTTTFFVTFQNNQSAQIIEDLNPQSFPSKLRYLLSFFQSTDYFAIKPRNNEEFDVVVTRAPNPEDIIWGNVMVPPSVRLLRKFLAFQVPLAFAGACIGIMFGIAQWQKKGAGHLSSVIVGIIVAVFSFLIKMSARLISRYQKDFTDTDRQRSILFKGILALAVNWSLPTIMTNIFSQSDNYTTEAGLIYQVFYIGIFNFFLPPILRLFDPGYYLYKIYICWKDRPYKKMLLKQSELNDLYEGEQYELGWCYLYFIDTFYFSCFYITIHPGVVIPGMLGCFAMFWAENHALLNRSQRPNKINQALTESVETLMLLGPLIMWLGHFIWVIRITGELTFSSTKFIANIVLLGLSVIYFLTPYKSIFRCLCHTPKEELLTYNECKNNFTHTYDGLNPARYAMNPVEKLMTIRQQKHIFNQSAGNIFDNEIIQAVVQSTKIPKIFGKYNPLSKKVSDSDLKQIKNSKRQQLQLFINPYKGSPQTNKGIIFEDSINVTQENLIQHDKKGIKNLNSNGLVFQRKECKKRTISVLDGMRNYEFDIENKEKK